MSRFLGTELHEILDNLHSTSELKAYLCNYDHNKQYDSFLNYFKSLDKVSSFDTSSLYKQSGIERSYCYHIMNGQKLPGRDKILRLCLAAGLTLDETQSALEAGREALLSALNPRDIIISYGIIHAFGVGGTNLLLSELGEDLIS